MEGFLDTNRYQKYTLAQSLQQIMFDHEIIFNKQAHELHQLYAVQKSTMKSDPNNTRCDFFPTFTENNSVGPTRFLLDQDFGSKFVQGSLDLRLSIGNSLDYEHDYDLNCEEINLSLSIGRSSNKRSRINGKYLKQNIVYPSSQDIIDLEESTETGSKNAANLHQDYYKKQESSMNGGMHQEWSSFNQGSKVWHEVKQTKLMDLDLNKSQPDESSFQSNEPLGPYPSSGGSYGESCSQITTSLTFKSQTNTKESQTKIYTIDLESLPEPSSDLTEDKEIHNEKKEEIEIQKAALSLISILQQQTSTRNQDSETKFGSNKKKTITRSCSVDSYESLVLKIEEISVDEDCATSKAFEINEFNQNQNGIKLKRGRRLKDFQKDILPTLSSLSKHEIWEDVKILEGVIRSREYKRLNKPKTGKLENWFSSVKSKRSKVNYVSLKKKK